MMMSETPKYEIKPVEALPDKTFHKASKYDPMIEAFLASSVSFATISAEDMTPEYLVVQLQKRIRESKRKDVSARMINKQVYLSRELEVKAKGKK